MIARTHSVGHGRRLPGVPRFPLLIKALNRIAFGVVRPPSARIGRGVLFSYKGLGTVVRKEAVIAIGANAVVLEDVPPYAVAVGVPARVVRHNRPDDLPNYRDY